MFHFGVHQFLLDNHEAGFAYGLPEHVMSLDHPLGQSIRVERHAPNTNEFCISAKLGNSQAELSIRYSVNIWCGDIEVCDIKNEETSVNADSWFRLCVVDLSESLNGMEERGEKAYLRVSLNVALTDEATENKRDLPGLSIRSAPISQPQQSGKKNRPYKLLAWQMFWVVAAKCIESYT